MPQVQVPVRFNDPPFFAFLASRSQDGQDDERWEQWNNPWRFTPVDHLRDQLHRTDAQGNLVQRIVIEGERRTPNAVDAKAVTNGMAWDAIERNHREIIIELVEERRAEDRIAGRPELVVQFYTGVIGNGFVGSTSNRTSNGILDLDKDADREKFKRAWFPWIECGVLSGLGHDAGMMNSRVEETYALIRNLEDWIDGWGSFSEAFPWISHEGGIVTEWAAVPDDIELWCLVRYMLQRDPANTHAVTRRDKQMWVASSPHITAGNTAPRRSGTLSVSEARNFSMRGFGVTSARIGAPWDAVVNLPPVGTPGPG